MMVFDPADETMFGVWLLVVLLLAPMLRGVLHGGICHEVLRCLVQRAKGVHEQFDIAAYRIKNGCGGAMIDIFLDLGTRLIRRS